MPFIREVRGVVVCLLLVVGLVSAASADARIVGGTTAPEGAYPAQAQVSIGAGGQSTLCGGTLVAAGWVLTAAHCVSDDASGALATPGVVTVRLGSTVLQRGTAHAVDAVLRAPDWSPVTLASDAALLHLAVPATQAPMPIAALGELAMAAAPGASARVVGWGQTSAQGGASPLLRHADVPVVADDACGSRGVYGRAFDKPTMLCAGGADADACFGDSGGPLLADADPSAATAWRLIGVVSWGHDCGSAGFPGVYTDLANARLRAWIGGTLAGAAVELPDAEPDVADEVVPAVSPTPQPAPAATPPPPVVTAPKTASIGLPSTCRHATCRVDLRFPSAGTAVLRLSLPRAVARRLQARAARTLMLARTTVLARRAGARTVHLRLPAALRRAMRRAGVRRIKARLHVEVLAYGTRVVGASRVVRVSR